MKIAWGWKFECSEFFTNIWAEDFNFQSIFPRTEMMLFELLAYNEAYSLSIPLLWPFVDVMGSLPSHLILADGVGWRCWGVGGS